MTLSINTLRAALLATATATVTALPGAALADPAVVLVHGAFADGSSWSKVIPILQQAGVEVAAVQLPLTSLSEDAAVTAHLVGTFDGPVVLVGHSYGGAVITEAGAAENVAGLVYVAAFTLEEGQSVADLLEGSGDAPAFKDAIVDGRGHIRMSAPSFATYFAPDLPAAEAAVYAATQTPLTAVGTDVPATVAAWRDTPVHYVVAENDQILPAKVQGYFAQKMGAAVTSVPSGHAAMLSQPEAVAEAILGAVAAAAQD